MTTRRVKTVGTRRGWPGLVAAGLLAILPGCNPLGGLTLSDSVERDLPASAAVFEPAPLVVSLNGSETLRLRSLSTLVEMTLGWSGGISVSDLKCEPADACTVLSGPEPGEGHRTVLRLRGLEAVTMSVRAVSLGRASVWAQLSAPGGCSFFCHGGTSGYRSVQVEVRP